MNYPQKRIAIFLPGLYGGGAERAMLNLATGFAKKGHAVDLVLAEAEGPYLADVPGTVRIVELSARRHSAFRTLASLPALVRYLKIEKPDALLSVMYANIVAVWARRLTGIPKRLVICEQNTFSYWNQQLSWWQSWLMLRLTRRFYPLANRIIGVSNGVADDLAKTGKIPRDRINVIYNPVVTPQLRKKAQSLLNHPWFKKDSPPVILSVCSLTVQKDLSTLIQAFAQIRQSRPVRLLILGEGEERKALENLAKRIGIEKDVLLPGFVGNPYSYMKKASVFVLSSKWEGLPTVLIEALFCGNPIVATDCPSGPREILRAGKYGILVPIGDVSLLANAISSVLDDTTIRPHSESWQPYELDVIVKQYINILFEH